MRVLAIDPSSTELGWAVLDSLVDPGLVAFGMCKAGDQAYEQRLPFIVQTLNQILGMFKPEAVACERAIRFKGKRIPALEVVVTCVKGWAKRHKLRLALYSPAEWKLSVVGYAQADKKYVSRIMCLMFRNQLSEDTPDHVTDAIAIGLHYLGVRKYEIMGLIQ